MLTDVKQAKAIFLDVVHNVPIDRWTSHVHEACSGNADLARQVEQLLRAHLSEMPLATEAVESIAAEVNSSTVERLGTLIGRYKLLEQVGEGGMGVVYVAEQTEPVRRRVALKIIKPGMDTKQVIARFEAERQALAMMDHPNIARVLDAGTTEAGRPYFVMELVRGMPITEYCDKARLSPRQRLKLFVDVCQAVQHAHQKGIIHRDLKPSNVMVTTNDGRPVVKVIDFGVAKAVGQQLTERTVYTALTQLVGTPLYMSPEQAELTSNDVDTRSDVYSLGVLLYELLTGQTPFDKDALSKAGFDEMRRIIREDEPLRPSRRFSTLGVQAISTASQHRGLDERRLSKILSGELDWIVMKALEKDRSRRYESASALAADIQRYLSDEPVLACPPTTMYRFQKFARKHKPALATAAAIALCLILGTTVSAWQAARATTAEAQANANEAQAKEAAAAEAKQRQRAEVNAAAAQEKEQEAIKQRDEVRALNDRLERTLYAAHMNLAHNAWDAGNIVRAQDLLSQHRPKPGEAGLRGFEWHYLNRLCHAEILTVKGKSWNSVAFSPDGRRLAFASEDDTVQVCEAQTGQKLRSLQLSPKFSAFSVAFSPDGKRLACGSAGNWDNANAKFTAGEVKVWDAQTGQELLTCKGHTGGVYRVAFRSDGKRLASASEDKTVKVWDAESDQELLTFKGNTAWVYSGVAFSPDGKRLAIAGGSEVKVWDAETGQELLAFKGHSDAVRSVAFSPDGKRLASASSDGTVKVWDSQAGQELFALKGHTGQVSGVAFSSDGKRLASSGADRMVKVWDAQTGSELLTFRGHTGHVISVVFSSDGTRLASGSLDGTVKIWDATTSPEAHTIDGLTNNVVCVAFSPDGKHLAAGTGSRHPSKKDPPGEVKVWDAQTSQELFICKGHSSTVSSVVYSADGKRLASASAGKVVKVWDAQTGQELLSLGQEVRIDDHGNSSLAFSPDGKLLAFGSGTWDDTKKDYSSGEVKVWDAQTGQELLTFTGHNNVVRSVAFSPDGKRLASASRNDPSSEGMVKVWDSQTGQELLTMKVSAFSAGRVAFSPDGKRLASSVALPGSGLGGADEIKVWDAQTGQELLSLRGHTTHVWSVVFSPDGKRLASGSGSPPMGDAGEVKVWDAETGQELLTIKGGAHLHGVIFSPDGHRLASCAGGTMKIYDATPLPEKP